MTRPWIAEEIVTDDTVRSLIEKQFPTLAPVRIEMLGAGPGLSGRY